MDIKGTDFKNLSNPYGEAEIERHIYQSPKGGQVFAP